MDKHTVATLATNVANLPAKDQTFARSLLDQFAGRGSLSPKQWEWVETLAGRATKPAAPVHVLLEQDFSGVVAFFAKASEHLKHPKIRLQLPDGKPIAISIAGPSAKLPGSVNVTDGGPFGASIWYGRVTPDGVWMPSQRATPEVQALLVHLAVDPVGTAVSYGRVTGNCCFCRQGLTDERSTDVGYGPVCAANWDLPWGAK